MSATTPTPSAEQEQRARWDLLLLDLEFRAEQICQLKRVEPWRVFATLASSVAVAGSAVAALILWIAHLIH
jgi:hypothetical protein